MKISGNRFTGEARPGVAPIATVKGEYVCKGTGFLAAPIALIDGEYIYSGTTKLGGADCQRQRSRQDERGSGGGVFVDSVIPNHKGNMA